MHKGWIAELKAIARAADDPAQAFLQWHAKLAAPDYIEALSDAIALAEIKGRGEIVDETDDPALAEPTIGTVTFKEAQEFLRQKVSLPSKTWTETLHHAHDRAFVVAGADSVALAEDRYLRWDPELAAFTLLEWTMRGWSGVTSFDPRAGKRQKPTRTYLEKQRRGSILYRRE